MHNPELTRLRLSDMRSAAPALLGTRNSRGRPLAVHMQSPPGMGKTALAHQIARLGAALDPGVPFCLGVKNLATASPTDVPGVLLFDSGSPGVANPDTTYGAHNIRRDIRSVYAKPAVARVSAVYYSVDGKSVTTLPTTNIHGEPLYFGEWMDVPGATHPTGEVRLRADTGILLLDEFMQAEADTRAAAAPLLDEGRAGDFVFPENVAVWAASNRAKDKSGVKKALAFLTNRVCLIEVEQTSPDEIEAYMGCLPPADPPPVIEALCESFQPRLSSRDPLRRAPAHPVVLAWMRDMHSVMFQGVPENPSEPYLTPRSAELVSNLFDAMLRLPNNSTDSADSVESRDGIVSPDDTDYGDEYEFRQRVFARCAAGIAGSQAAAAFMGILDLWGRLPSVEAILADPRNIEVESRADVQMLLAQRAASALNPARPKQVEAAMKFLTRPDLIPAIAESAIVHAIVNTRNGGALYSSPHMRDFLANNKATMLRISAALKNRRA